MLEVALLDDGRAAGADSDAGAGAGAVARRLAALQCPAYQVAARIFGAGADAEDVVQQSYLRAFEALRSGPPPASERAWFLKIVANTARNHLRDEAGRRRRQTTLKPELHAAPVVGSTDAPGRELLDRLRGAMDELEEPYRLPVALCCEQGLSQREAAEVLDLPASTVSKYVNAGIEQLRRTLARAGYTAAPAAIVGGLAGTAPPVPATLAAAVEKLLAGGVVAKGTGSAAAAAGAALKGGLIVKIGLGVAAAGLVAGGVFWAVGPSPLPSSTGRGSEGEGAAKPAEKVPGKDFPYGEGVVYKREYAAIGSFRGGIQDGPGAEMEISGDTPRAMAPNGDWYFLGQEKDLVIMRYDARKKRASVIAWSGPVGKRGGPAECARFAGGGYAAGMGLGVDPTGKYLIVSDANNNGYQWKMDLEKFIVEPTSGAEAVKGSAVRGAAPDGSYYFARDDCKLRKVSPDGKTVQDLGVQLDRPLLLPSGRGNLLVDEKLGRLWTMTRDPYSPWGIVWYWDIKTGKATGVTGAKKDKDGRYVLCDGSPATKDGTSPEYHCSSGPAGKTTFWCASGMTFGPDRGERYVYLGGGDESTCTRIDHVKGYVTKLVKADPKDRSLWTFGEGRQGKDVNFNDPYNWAPCPHWGPDGEFYMAWALASAIDVYRPVQK